ncbi:Serine carboxypeptidase family protein [Aspergillus niger]|uniref:Serine carboxypeptidase family protein n=1 Tax=Aspergillus niger TaxID=5061 RepID=A0A505IBP5_ASPNG|nr:Serine carboxypeptidase family protein [Aspergillus niger]
MSGKVPHAAFCEEYDEDAHVILPDTRQVANLTSKRSKPALRSPAAPLVDVASDSGYSSRTAATVNSTQSGPSGRKSPVPLKLDTTLVKRADLVRVRSKSTREQSKPRIVRPPREDKMQVGAYPNGVSHAPAHAQRSPSRPRRRETSQMRHYPGTCWECDQGLYHASSSTPVDSRPSMDYPYYMSQPPSSAHDYPPPPSPRGDPRYAPNPVQDIHVSRSSRPSARGGGPIYHPNNRPMSFHGMLPGMGQMVYQPSGMSRYEHGPPPSSSAYAYNPSSYAPSHYSQQSPYYSGMSDYGAPSEHRQERSVSSTRDGRGRRPSVYGAPVVDYDSPSAAFDDDEPLDAAPPAPPPPPREPRPRLPSHSSHDRDEDYYRRPPLKHKNTPHIIQKRPEPRKGVSAPSVTSGHSARSFDMADMKDALPDGYGYRRSSRETVVPARSRSYRRPTAYHDSARPSRIAVENSRRLKAPVPPAPPVPLTADALFKAKSSQRAESDSGSQKSRSSRGSDARTQSGSNAGSKPEEDNNIVMTLNGVTMSFPQDGGKKISVRTGETGAVELNIEGKQRPKKYLTNGSEYTGSVAHSRREIEDARRVREIEDSRRVREIEDARRVRSDRKSDRASRRSSRSTYGGRY